MEPVDFYKLPRSAQERFIGSLDGTGLPSPILRATPRPVAPFVWLAGAGIACIVLLLSLGVGFGDLGSRLASRGTAWLLVDSALVGLACFAATRGAALLHEHASSPFRRGLYVFPVGLIDARRSTLAVYRIEDLAGVFGPDVRGVTLEFEGRAFSFPEHDPSRAAAAKESLAGARAKVSEAGAARESVRPKAMAAIDPLQGYSNPLASPDSIVQRRPAWDRLSWATALGLGLVLGGGLWRVRDVLSDNAMFAHAQSKGDSDAFLAYLARGARHAVEVRTVLLPRALLRDAERIGTVEAVEQFMREHPDRAIAAEAKASLRAALLRELDAAIKPGTLAALDEFARRRPRSAVEPELVAARHRVYQTAVDRYMLTVADRVAPSTIFVQRLLAWAEQHGPRVEVRLHRKRAKTLERADAAAGKSRQWKGVVSLPSRYFDDAAEKGDMAALASAIAQRFQALFPMELLAVELAEPLADPDAPLPAQISAPTLFVEPLAVWAGSIQASQKPRGVFVGLELAIDGTFRVPDDARPVRVRVDGWHVPDLPAARDAEKPEEAVYGTMRARAFDLFQRRLFASLFTGGK